MAVMLPPCRSRIVDVLASISRRPYSSTPSPRLLKILFLGSDQFSIGSLKAVLQATGLWESINVVTSASKEAGRGKAKKIVRPQLLDFAEENNLPVEQIPLSGIKHWLPPAPFTTPDPSHHLLTASFGHILPNSILQLFPLGSQRLNVHPSLLPKYRGAAPIQWAIANRDRETGVGVQSLAKTVDGGELWGMRAGLIGDQDRYEQILPRLADVGGDLLLKVLKEIQAGNAQSQPQNPALVSRAPKITKGTACVDFDRMSAQDICALDRGIGSQHPLWSEFDELPVQLFDLHELLPSESESLHARLTPGAFELSHGGLAVLAGDGSRLAVAFVKPAGGKKMSARDWWNGLRDKGNRSLVFERPRSSGNLRV